MTDIAITASVQEIKNVITFGGMLGEYSIGLHLSLIMASVLMFGMLLATIVRFRGQGVGLVAVCMQDVLIGFVCALMIFTALGLPFFWGRAVWRACTWKLVQA